MREIATAVEMMEVATRQGVPFSVLEAEIVLGYMEGHDYCLLVDDGFRMMLHDKQDGEEHGEDIQYTVRDAIEFCQEMNDELLTETASREKPDQSYLLDLRKDEFILGELMKKAEAVNPFVAPRMVRRYDVVIVEHLKKVVTTEAESWDEAKKKVEREWKEGEHILNADDFAGVTFTLGG